MKIGILQTGHAPHDLQARSGDYTDMFQHLLGGHGFHFETYNVVDMEFPKDIHDAEGWLITGSRHGAYDDLPFIAPLEAFIRKIYDAGVPTVGICFGHQIIAQALGGKVEKYPGGWSVGRQIYELDGEEVALNAWHQDQVTRIPEGATVCATSPFCANAGLIYGSRMFTMQPHPEFNADFIEGLARTRGPGVVPDDLLAQASESLSAPTDSALIADRIAHFFHQRM